MEIIIDDIVEPKWRGCPVGFGRAHAHMRQMAGRKWKFYRCTTWIINPLCPATPLRPVPCFLTNWLNIWAGAGKWITID